MSAAGVEFGPAVGLPLVLLVGSETRVAEAVAGQLRKSYRVMAQPSAAGASRILDTEDVSVVLAEQKLAQGSGVEFLEQVRGRLPDVPRILLSTSPASGQILRAVQEGRLFHCLAKPWHPSDLESVVARATEHFQLLRERRALVNQLRQSSRDMEVQLRRRAHLVAEHNRLLEQALQTIGRISRHDELTGLANRRHLEEMVRREAARARRNGTPICLLHLEVNRFQQITDLYGCTVANRLLQAVARRLTDNLRPWDLAARLDKAEFVVVLPETRLAEAQIIGEQLLQEIAGVQLPGLDLCVSAGMRVAELTSSDQLGSFLNPAGALDAGCARGAERLGGGVLESAAEAAPGKLERSLLHGLIM